MEELELSIVMPCLNEELTVAVCIEKAQRFIGTHGVAGEVVIADNNSTDSSRERARAAGARVVEVAEKGYGAAILGGIAAARGKFVIVGDADDSYDFSALSPFLDRLRNGYDLVVGNRFLGGIKAGAMPRLHQYLGNPVLTKLGRRLYGIRVGDFHCGLRGFRRELADEVGLRTPGMEFASEMIIAAALKGKRITEVPTILYPDGRDRAPHLRTWRDGFRHLKFMLLFSPNWLFIYPGLVVLALGVSVSALLIAGPVVLAGVTFDVHTLLYAALLILVGFQMFCFGVFTRILAVRDELAPADASFRRLRRLWEPNRGIAAGLLLIAIGLTGTLFAGLEWRSVHFSDLDPRSVLRRVIPAFVFVALGCQLTLSSFFLGFLDLRLRSKATR